MNTDKGKTKIRSASFILAYQLEGLCSALRRVVPAGLMPGKTSIDLLKKFYKDFSSMHSGGPCENLPEITDSISAFDMLQAIPKPQKMPFIALKTPIMGVLG